MKVIGSLVLLMAFATIPFFLLGMYLISKPNAAPMSPIEYFVLYMFSLLIVAKINSLVKLVRDVISGDIRSRPVDDDRDVATLDRGGTKESK